MWSVVNRDFHQKCKRVMVQNPNAKFKSKGKWRRLHLIAASYKRSLGPCTRGARPRSYALQFGSWYTIQRELVQIEAADHFCLPVRSLQADNRSTPSSSGEDATSIVRSGAGVEPRWWQRPITRLQQLVTSTFELPLTRHVRAAAHTAGCQQSAPGAIVASSSQQQE